MSLPAAEDLFRPTVVPDRPEEVASDHRPERKPGPARRPSGRVRHDEKMTVYVTSNELLDLERARLQLRSEHGLGVDRGRLVREAIAIVLADYAQNGDESVIVQRLAGEA